MSYTQKQIHSENPDYIIQHYAESDVQPSTFWSSLTGPDLRSKTDLNAAT